MHFIYNINTNKKGGSTFSLMLITSCVPVLNLTLNAFRFVGFFCKDIVK